MNYSHVQSLREEEEAGRYAARVQNDLPCCYCCFFYTHSSQTLQITLKMSSVLRQIRKELI